MVKQADCAASRSARSIIGNAFFHPGYTKMTPGFVIDERVTSVNTGIVILGVDGGLVENIRFSNIVMTDVLSPFFIRVGARFLIPEGKPSVMRGVSSENVTAVSRSIIPSIVAGLKDSPIRDVRLSNIRISVPIGAPTEMAAQFPADPPESIKGYPENRLTFGLQLPAAAFYVRHVEDIDLVGVTLTHAENEARPPFTFDDVRNIRLRDVRVNGHPLTASPEHIQRKNSSEPQVRD